VATCRIRKVGLDDNDIVDLLWNCGRFQRVLRDGV